MPGDVARPNLAVVRRNAAKNVARAFAATSGTTHAPSATLRPHSVPGLTKSSEKGGRTPPQSAFHAECRAAGALNAGARPHVSPTAEPSQPDPSIRTRSIMLLIAAPCVSTSSSDRAARALTHHSHEPPPCAASSRADEPTKQPTARARPWTATAHAHAHAGRAHATPDVSSIANIPGLDNRCRKATFWCAGARKTFRRNSRQTAAGAYTSSPPRRKRVGLPPDGWQRNETW
jgi:hypothetical protein